MLSPRPVVTPSVRQYAALSSGSYTNELTGVSDEFMVLYGGAALSSDTGVAQMLDDIFITVGPDYNSWFQPSCASVISPRYAHASTVIGSQLYVSGGMNEWPAGKILTDIAKLGKFTRNI